MTTIDTLWTTEKEDVLKTYAEESECMYIAYTKEYIKYRFYGYCFTIPNIIISTVSGLLAFNADFSGSSNGPTIIGSLNILVAIVATVYKTLKYGDLEARFNFLAGEYLKLHSEIQSTLDKDPLERDNALEFIRKIESKKIQLIDDAPVISKETRKKFMLKYKNSKIILPVLLSKINPIRIYGRDIPSEIQSVKTETSLEDNRHIPAVNNSISEV
jgi:hypothetical protein